MKPWNLDGKRSARRMGIDSVRIVDAPPVTTTAAAFCKWQRKKAMDILIFFAKNSNLRGGGAPQLLVQYELVSN